jgi:hypothetical protein
MGANPANTCEQPDSQALTDIGGQRGGGIRHDTHATH